MDNLRVLIVADDPPAKAELAALLADLADSSPPVVALVSNEASTAQTWTAGVLAFCYGMRIPLRWTPIWDNCWPSPTICHFWPYGKLTVESNTQGRGSNTGWAAYRMESRMCALTLQL